MKRSELESRLRLRQLKALQLLQNNSPDLTRNHKLQKKIKVQRDRAAEMYKLRRVTRYEAKFGGKTKGRKEKGNGEWSDKEKGLNNRRRKE